jgi:hypothetical protein
MKKPPQRERRLTAREEFNELVLCDDETMTPIVGVCLTCHKTQTSQLELASLGVPRIKQPCKFCRGVLVSAPWLAQSGTQYGSR